MSKENGDSGPKLSSSAQSSSDFIWPLNKSLVPDEMNTSYGPRIDADRWDFHDGIDLPAAIGTSVYVMADGVVHRAGPADKTGPGEGFGSTHVLVRVVDPTDGKNDLYLVYLHLDSIAEGVIRQRRRKGLQEWDRRGRLPEIESKGGRVVRSALWRDR